MKDYEITGSYVDNQLVQTDNIEIIVKDSLPYMDSLICWLDPSDTTSISGTVIKDKSGNNAHFETHNCTINSNYIQFSKNRNSYADCSNIKTCPNGYTVFYRRNIKNTSGEVFVGLSKRGVTSGIGEFQLDYGVSDGRQGFFNYDSSPSYNSSKIRSYTLETIYQINGTYTSPSGSSNLGTKTLPSSNVSNYIVLGRSPSSETTSVYSCTMDFYRLAIYNRTLTSSEISDVLNVFNR